VSDFACTTPLQGSYVAPKEAATQTGPSDVTRYHSNMFPKTHYTTISLPNLPCDNWLKRGVISLAAPTQDRVIMSPTEANPHSIFFFCTSTLRLHQKTKKKRDI